MVKTFLAIVFLFLLNAVAQVPEIGIEKTITPDWVVVDAQGSASDEMTINLTLAPPNLTRVPADVVLAIDCSASMFQVDSNLVRKDAALEFIGLLDPNKDRVSVLPWRDTPLDHSKLTGNFEEAKQALARLPNDIGGTDFDNALYAAIKILDDNPRPNQKISRSIIFLTDALPEGTKDAYNYSKQTVEEAKKKGYRIYTVGIKPYPTGITDLEEMATLTGAIFVYATDNQALRPIYRDLSKIIPYEVVATNARINDILPPYLAITGDLIPHVNMMEYIYNQEIKYDPNYDTESTIKQDMWDNSKTIRWNWGSVVANSNPLTLNFKVKFQNPLPVDLVTSDQRINAKNLNSVLSYSDINDKLHFIQIAPMKLTIKAKEKNGIPGFTGILAITSLFGAFLLWRCRK